MNACCGTEHSGLFICETQTRRKAKSFTTLPLWEVPHDQAAHISRRCIDHHERGKSRRAIGDGSSGRTGAGRAPRVAGRDEGAGRHARLCRSHRHRARRCRPDRNASEPGDLYRRQSPDGAAQRRHPRRVPAVAKSQPRYADLDLDNIVVVTIPQPAVVQMIRTGGLALGNLVLEVSRKSGFYPDIVMAGAEPLRELRKLGTIEPQARFFSRNRGFALLVRKGNPRGIHGLVDVARSGGRIALPGAASEPQARARYRADVYPRYDFARM